MGIILYIGFGLERGFPCIVGCMFVLQTSFVVASKRPCKALRILMQCLLMRKPQRAAMQSILKHTHIAAHYRHTCSNPHFNYVKLGDIFYLPY